MYLHIHTKRAEHVSAGIFKDMHVDYQKWKSSLHNPEEGIAIKKSNYSKVCNWKILSVNLWEIVILAYV